MELSYDEMCETMYHIFQAMQLRQEVAMRALSDCLSWLKSENGDVAIFDATNTTLERRRLVHEHVVDNHGYGLLFIESICTKKDVIDDNIMEVKVHGPDYEYTPDKEMAMADFKERIAHYQDTYVKLDEAEGDDSESKYSYMKIINAGERLVIANCHSSSGGNNLRSKIGYWLMNVHIRPRTIYLTRHGESMFNTEVSNTVTMF